MGSWLFDAVLKDKLFSYSCEKCESSRVEMKGYQGLFYKHNAVSCANCGNDLYKLNSIIIK